MKNIKFLFLLSFLTFAVVSCDDTTKVDTGVVEGGLLDVLTPIITHIQASTDTYSASFSTYQGSVKTTDVEVYKQFVGVAGTSEKVLHKSINIADQSLKTTSSFDFTFAELKDGLTLNGAALPIDDDLEVGDGIILTYVAKTSQGNSHQSAGTTEIAISGRYAGVYQVIESDYWRIGVQSGFNNWVGYNRVIKSIDANTYEHVGWGPWSSDDNGPGSHASAFFFFSVDGDLNIDYYPEDPDGATITGLGSYLITCDTDPNDMTNVPCATSNIAVKDDVNGKDRLIMVYGYYSAGNDDPANDGPREFYEVLEKL